MIEKRLLNKNPIIFSFPHSGFNYSSKFLNLTSLDIKELRRSEDAYVDELFSNTIKIGFSYIKAFFPRIYIDVNRHPLEIDPKMFSFKTKYKTYKDKSKIDLGIGLISKFSIYGNNIYYDLLSKKELSNRLLNYYFPYHRILKNILTKVKHEHNNIILLDCHSMPSSSLYNDDVDVVLGNNNGVSISKNLFIQIKDIFIKNGFKIQINEPYSGGFITKYYGKPESGINVIQIEFNRKKYINEYSLNRKVNNMRIISEKITNTVLEIKELLFTMN